MSKPIQPKSVRKMITRTAILGAVMVVAIFGYKSVLGNNDPSDIGTADTKGWVAAIQQADDGNQLVIIKPDGTIMPAPGYVKGKEDRDPVWRPDGNRVFFSSDREEGAFNIYRWNLANNLVERRTLGKIGKSQPSFAPKAPLTDKYPLMVFGGTAWELDETAGKGFQVVPPNKKGGQRKPEASDASADKEGAAGAELKIKYVRYLAGKAGLMYVSHGDAKEGLGIQPNVQGMSEKDIQEKGQPSTILAGEKLWLDTSPIEPIGFVSIQHFALPEGMPTPPQFIKDGKLELPFHNLIAKVNPTGKPPFEPVIQGAGDNIAFGPLSVSPSGDQLAIVVGFIKENEFHGQAIFVGPAKPAPASDFKQVYPNQANQPASDNQIKSVVWSPDGKHLLIQQRANSHSDIVVMEPDGGNVKNLTNGKGQFTQPVMSPQG